MKLQSKFQEVRNKVDKLILIIMLFLITPVLGLSQENDMYEDEDYIYDYDTIIPLYSVKDSLLKTALDSLYSVYGGSEPVSTRWDLVLSDTDSVGVQMYFSKPFFSFMHKVGYGFFTYKDFSFVVRGIKYSGLVETNNSINLCVCNIYPPYTWDPPCALFIRQNEEIRCGFIRK